MALTPRHAFDYELNKGSGGILISILLYRFQNNVNIIVIAEFKTQASKVCNRWIGILFQVEIILFFFLFCGKNRYGTKNVCICHSFRGIFHHKSKIDIFFPVSVNISNSKFKLKPTLKCNGYLGICDSDPTFVITQKLATIDPQICDISTIELRQNKRKLKRNFSLPVYLRANMFCSGTSSHTHPLPCVPRGKMRMFHHTHCATWTGGGVCPAITHQGEENLTWDFFIIFEDIYFFLTF